MDNNKNNTCKMFQECQECEQCITGIIELRPEKYIQTLYANDFMSPQDYMELVRLSLLKTKVETEQNETILILGYLGKTSKLHPFKSKKIKEKQIELQSLKEQLQDIKAHKIAILDRYEKVRKSLVNGLLRKGGYTQTHEHYNNTTLSWEFGGVRLVDDQIVNRCLNPKKCINGKFDNIQQNDIKSNAAPF